MNNCYCGHPKERHQTSLAYYLGQAADSHQNCFHCACSLYWPIESQEPKALEEKPLYKCGGFCRGTHGPECNVFKPQESLPQSCPECHYPKGKAHARRCCMRLDGLVGEPCHQESETEPLDLLKKSKESVKVGVFAYEYYIILPRPKGRTISNLLFNFIHGFWYKQHMTDEEVMNAWSKFLKSIEK